MHTNTQAGMRVHAHTAYFQIYCGTLIKYRQFLFADIFSIGNPTCTDLKVLEYNQIISY